MLRSYHTTPKKTKWKKQKPPKRPRKLLEMINVAITLIVEMASHVFVYVQTY